MRCRACGRELAEIDMSHRRDGRVRSWCKRCACGDGDSSFANARREYAEAFDAGLLRAGWSQNKQRQFTIDGVWRTDNAIEQQLACQYAYSNEDYSNMTDDDWDRICAEAGGYSAACDKEKKAYRARRQREQDGAAA